MMDLDIGVVQDVEKRQKKRLLLDYLADNLKHHNWWAYRYFFCEFLALVNIIGKSKIFFNHWNKYMSALAISWVLISSILLYIFCNQSAFKYQNQSSTWLLKSNLYYLSLQTWHSPNIYNVWICRFWWCVISKEIASKEIPLLKLFSYCRREIQTS